MTRLFLSFLAVLFLASCGDSPPPLLKESSKLIVLTREGPTTFKRDHNGVTSGFEHDLVQMFAKELGLKVKFVTVKDEAEIAKKLISGKAHFAAAWLSPPDRPELMTGPNYYASSNVIALNEAAIPLTSRADLAGKEILVQAGSRQAHAAQELSKSTPGIVIHERPLKNPLDLLEQAAKQRDTPVLVDKAILDIATNFYPQLQQSVAVGDDIPIAWQFPVNADPELLLKAVSFIERIRENGQLARLIDRYFGHIERLKPIDVMHFIERIRTELPKYKPLFQAAQASTGIDWRYLAALAYQESHWDPLATSPTGVRGMMMLTEDTADHLKVSNRLDAMQSIRAGSEYFADLRDSLPASVPEPDRTWLATAAYNLGMGHLKGARYFAQRLKKDPDAWYDMKAVLPLLSRPEYYQRLKSGKARGGEAVIMTENVRMYFDILSRYEAPYRPAITMAEIKR
ncbi:MAG: membrane-bound lytic murein transglycosylase MltF [Zoogloeaceae bacterium]|nr:membrane-bound lytic murein transglycosylase MltF [Zoogloeaceae bacterium]